MACSARFGLVAGGRFLSTPLLRSPSLGGLGPHPATAAPFSLLHVQRRPVQQRRHYSDDSHADPLHYHPLPPADPQRLALSFLEQPPPTSESRTIVGFLPLVPGREPCLSDFVENEGFKGLLHQAIKQAIAEGDERIVAEAQGRVEGWINLTDDRNPGLPGRVGDADDLIGSFYVQEGKADADTYQAMPSYRLLTVDGPTVLSETMMDRLRALLRHTADEESRSHPPPG